MFCFFTQLVEGLFFILQLFAVAAGKLIKPFLLVVELFS